MLVRADAIPVVEMIKAAEAVDAGAAALWLHMGIWDALGEMIDDNRPEIDAVWKSVVVAKNATARRILVRQAVERRVEGDSIDDVVKAAAGLSLVHGYVAKDDDEDGNSSEARSERAQRERRDSGGRFAVTQREKATYDALQGLTTRNSGLESSAQSVARELNDRKNAPYAQMRVLGNGLVASGNPKAMAAGGVVRIAAEVGPSAEDVLGTHLRRAAYRYRGTEKRPDRGLVQQVKESQAYVAGLSAHATSLQDQQYQATLRGQLDDRKPGEWAKGAVALRAAQEHESEDQFELRATSDVAAAHLIRQLPTQDEAFLSQEAGRTPPSVGVIVDRDGDVVTEAMGYNGDHYVPFDLKNLKRLQGGSYVRTRALGGPTSEDIYTGLLAGARQMTVVSRSGVFTVEFDPDLRGGRRYSDKARQMVDRYSRLLDVVEAGANHKGEPIYTQDIPEDRKRQLRAEAARAADYDEDEAKTIYARRLKQERAKAQSEGSFSEDDLDSAVDSHLRDWVRNRTESGHAPGRPEIGRAREQIRGEVRQQMAERRQQGSVERLRLNAEGYYRAMQSLAREFPYYIRDVAYESLPEFEEKRNTRQRGERQLPFGAPGAAATSTHVSRGKLMPARQAEAYRRRTDRETPTDDSGQAAPVGATPPPSTPGAPAATGATFEETLKNEKFQEQLAGQLNVLKIANVTVGEPPAPVVELPVPASGRYDKDYANSLSAPAEYVKWLVHPGNTVTQGEGSKIARFLTEEATPAEVRRVQDGLAELQDVETPLYPKPRREALGKTLEGISRARKPYADMGGSPVLHSPDREDPKPYPFPEVAGHAMDSDEKFNKARRHLENSDQGMTVALDWAEGLTDERAAAQLRTDVREFKAAQKWGEARRKAKKDGDDELPEKPDDVADSVDATLAEEIAEAPEKTSAYKQIARRQRAWAWIYTQRLRDQLRGITGGGAAPKVKAIEGEKKARWDGASPRRVVWHDPADPLSQALAKRLSRPRRTI